MPAHEETKGPNSFGFTNMSTQKDVAFGGGNFGGGGNKSTENSTNNGFNFGRAANGNKPIRANQNIQHKDSLSTI